MVHALLQIPASASLISIMTDPHATIASTGVRDLLNLKLPYNPKKTEFFDKFSININVFTVFLDR